MLYIFSDELDFHNEIIELTRIFFPNKKILWTDNLDNIVLSQIILLKYKYTNTKGNITINISLYDGGILIYEQQNQVIIDDSDNTLKVRRQVKNAIKRSIYTLLSKYTGKQFDWGILTGIRPTKIVHQLFDENQSNASIFATLIKDYKISNKKASMLIDIAKTQRPFLINNRDKDISIYINIPICKTKCLFCSFPSDTIEHCSHLIDAYLEALIYELDTLVNGLNNYGYRFQSIYIGGGTPTVLSNKQLSYLLLAVGKLINLDAVDEYTVEGGRPDSMDVDKLSILKEHRVTRISINPQTMNKKTLDKIGRQHAPEQVITCYENARKLGFKSINMDVILGLPNEGFDSVNQTMEIITGLNPDNITVHTLSIKRSSRLKESLDQYTFPNNMEIEDCFNACKEWVVKTGYIPYYMYRQKYMLGNMENVGYAKPGYECLYNIQMMEEKQTILAFGAGAVSKVFFPSQDRIIRVPNVKNIVHYINRVDEMIEKKKKVLNFS